MHLSISQYLCHFKNTYHYLIKKLIFVKFKDNIAVDNANLTREISGIFFTKSRSNLMALAEVKSG